MHWRGKPKFLTVSDSLLERSERSSIHPGMVGIFLEKPPESEVGRKATQAREQVGGESTSGGGEKKTKKDDLRVEGKSECKRKTSIDTSPDQEGRGMEGDVQQCPLARVLCLMLKEKIDGKEMGRGRVTTIET